MMAMGMKRVVVAAVLACAVVAAAAVSPTVTATVKSDTYANKYLSPHGDMGVSWQLTPDKKSLLVEMRAQTEGWISWAVGLSESMIGLDSFVAYVNGTDLVFYDGYCDDFHMAPRDSALGGTDDVRDVSHVMLNDDEGNPVFIVQFTRDVEAHDEYDVAITDSLVYFALAKGPLRDGRPRKHDAFVIVSMNVMSGIVSYAHSTLRPLHATFMLVSWGFFIPCGILVARFFKVVPSWFWTHVGLQITGLVFTLAGLAVILVSLGGHYQSTAHAGLGVAVIAAGLIQLLLGVLGSFCGVSPRVMDISHRHFGRLVAAASFAQLILGVWRLQSVDALYWLLGAWMVALSIASIAMTLREHALKKKSSTMSKNPSGEIILQQLAEMGDKEAIASQAKEEKADGVTNAIFGVWVIAAIALVVAIVVLCFLWSTQSL